MSGKTTINKRYEILNEFKDSNIGIICSAKVLNEGVNIPCIDTVMFVDPRKSTIDVTQCTGRGMRLYGNQEKCTIIIPIHYDNVADEHNFSPIVKILTAMNEIDDNIVEYFSVKERNNKIVVRNMDVVDWIDNGDYEVGYNIDDVINNLSIRVMNGTELSWEIKKRLLFKYCDKNESMPKICTEYKKNNPSEWYFRQKTKINGKDDDKYIKLSSNKYVKENLDNYLDPYKQWNEWKKILFKYCNLNECIPSCRIIYENRRIGSWLQAQKGKINNVTDILYKKLCTNPHVKINLDEYLYKKAQNINIKKLNIDGWKELLFEYSNINECVPTNKTNYKSYNIGAWLQCQKKKINNVNNDIYIKLSANVYVKTSLDDYLENKEKNMGKVKLEQEEWKELLFECCDMNKCAPSGKFSYQNHKIGSWLSEQKKKINSKNDNLYIKLSTNEYVKESIDNYLEHKAKNNGEKRLEWEEWKELLFEYCDINKSVPSNSVSYKNYKIGQWLQHQKKKINSKNDNIYIKMAINKYVKENLDNYLNPNKVWNDKKNMLFEYCDKNKAIPSRSLVYKNHNLSTWLQNQKKKINSTDSKIYKQLAENNHGKESLDKYLEKK
jgi:hypothetical protein